MDEQKNPSKVDSVIINDDAEAPTLLNPFTGQILITNRVGKRIIELADGSRTVEDIARQVSREFKGVQEPLVKLHAETFLAAATQKGIVTWTARS